MSNFLFNGFEFDELNSSFKLQNVCPIYLGETGQMKLPLLNNQNSGYVLNTSTLYNNNPDFLLNQQIDTTTITLLKYDGTDNVFKFNKNIDLQNFARISNSLDPVNDKDLVTKSFLESSIGGLGPGTVTSIALTTNTNGLSISGSPVTSGGIININLSNQLQNFSSLGMGSLNQVLSVGSGSNFLWRSVGTVTSVGISTAINSGITVTNSPITLSGNINLALSSNLQAFNTLGYGANGQVLTMTSGAYSWVTPATGGNVTGSSTTTVNGLALWNNTTGTSLGSTNFTLDVNGNLNLNSKRIVSAQDPVAAQDYSTKNYVDLNTGFRNCVVFTTVGAGSWTIPTNITRCKITAIGGGGGGGGAKYSFSDQGGNGGGGGATMIKWLSGLTSGGTISFNIGTGGTGGVASSTGQAASNGSNTTVTVGGVTYTAGGGVGGNAWDTNNTINTISTGGTATNGDLNIPGTAGNSGVYRGATTYMFSGNGGNSTLGAGGTGRYTQASNTSLSGNNGNGYGGGGGGAYANSTTGASGGNGSPGIVIIEY